MYLVASVEAVLHPVADVSLQDTFARLTPRLIRVTVCVVAVQFVFSGKTVPSKVADRLGGKSPTVGTSNTGRSWCSAHALIFVPSTA